MQGPIGKTMKNKEGAVQTSSLHNVDDSDIGTSRTTSPTSQKVDQNEKELVNINLRGVIFTTSSETLKSYPHSKLGKLESEKTKYQYNAEKNEYFFNRNPSLFHQILDFYSTNKLHIPTGICPESVREELEFWEISQSLISKCCWKTFYIIDDELRTMDTLLQYTLDDEYVYSRNENVCVAGFSHLHSCLNNNKPSILAKIWRCIMGVTVIVSTIVYVMQTNRAHRVPRAVNVSYDVNNTNSKLKMFFETENHWAIVVLELFCNTILTLDWLLRFSSCSSKKKFFKSFLNVTDVLACIGVWCYIGIEENVEAYRHNVFKYFTAVVAVLYTLRVFRVFRLFMEYSEMRILILSLRFSLMELLLLFLSFGSFAVIFAGLIYVCEFDSETFVDISVSIWWSIITMTTVGYGDFVPKSTCGYLVGVVCALFGILLIALPVAVMSSNFNSLYDFERYRTRHFKHLLGKKSNVFTSRNKVEVLQDRY